MHVTVIGSRPQPITEHAPPPNEYAAVAIDYTIRIYRDLAQVWEM